MSISSESPAESAAQMSEEAGTGQGPAEQPRHRVDQGGPAPAVGEERAGVRRAGGRTRRRPVRLRLPRSADQGRCSRSSCSAWRPRRSTSSTTRATSRPTAQHPTKRFRPIAAGVVPEWLAYALAVVLGVASLAISWLVTPNLAVVMAVYIAIQLAYCFGLKHQPVHRHLHRVVGLPDPRHRRRRRRGCAAVAMVPAGDGVRVAVHGGRQALRRTAARRTHRRQDPQIAGELHQLAICASCGRCRRPRWCSATACGRSSATAPTRSWFAVTIIPFTIAILRYAVDVDGGMAGEPEEIALKDRVLQLLGAGVDRNHRCRRLPQLTG